MKRRKRIMVFILSALLLAVTACGEGGSKAPKEKKYKWDDAEFTVKSIQYSTESTESQDDTGSGKRVSVIIDFGDNQISQKEFERNVINGKFTFAGKKPTDYNYHIGGMMFEGTGFVQKITGETEVFFDLDSDYELNESDLASIE